MKNRFEKTIVRMSFEAVLNALKNELYNDGFEVGGTTDFQNHLMVHTNVTCGKYKILAVYDPFFYREMMMFSPAVGVVLPCLVSILELYPGETAIVFYNATEQIARDMNLSPIGNLAKKVTEKLDATIRALSKVANEDPDLITSWS